MWVEDVSFFEIGNESLGLRIGIEVRIVRIVLLKCLETLLRISNARRSRNERQCMNTSSF